MRDGFYLLYDPDCYGWEPIWVFGNNFTRCGRAEKHKCLDYMTGRYAWKPIDLPSNP